MEANDPVNPTNDPVNHPSHYTSSPARCECGRQIECIDVTQHLNFCRGNAVKYLWRAGSKGNEAEDLKKAAWYISREIESLSDAHCPVDDPITARSDESVFEKIERDVSRLAKEGRGYDAIYLGREEWNKLKYEAEEDLHFVTAAWNPSFNGRPIFIVDQDRHFLVLGCDR